MPGLTVAFLLAATNASAADVSGTMDTATMEGAVVTGIHWTLRPGPTDSELKVQAAGLTVDGISDRFTDLKLECPRLRVTAAGNACAEGDVQLDFAGQTLAGIVSWEQWGPSLRLTAETGLFGGRVRIELEADDLTERVSFQARELSLPVLMEYLQAGGEQALTVSAGTLMLEGTLAPDPGGAGLAEVTFAVRGMDFDSSDGTRAGAGLGLSGEARIELDSQPLAVRSRLTLEDGEALFSPLYVAFDALPPVTLNSEVRVAADGAMSVPSFSLTDTDSLALSGSAEIDGGGELRSFVVEIEKFSLPLGFDRYLKSALEGFRMGSLRTVGSLQGRLQLGVAAALEHVSVHLQDFGAEDEQERFLVDNLNGVLDYDAAGESLDSQLSWERIGYYALGIRASGARFFVGGRQFKLLDPVFAPVLNGGLQIDELAIEDFGLETLAVDFQGQIIPISLQQITEALEWPVLQGTLSGEIPRVRVKSGVGMVGGAIRLDVFDGQVIVDQVRLERLFGVLPTLAAEVDISGVDLEQMTGAFSFGKITGRMNGTVHGLRLLDWQPVAFDLVLATPDDYRGKRKISQRAVENLSSLGGGAAALSATFLRFFKNFSYRRLGLKCRLADNVCQMSGLSPAGRGFYIVEGAGIPRINIIGYSTRVNWPQLIRRLQAATRSGGPSFE